MQMKVVEVESSTTDCTRQGRPGAREEEGLTSLSLSWNYLDMMTVTEVRRAPDVSHDWDYLDY